MPLRLFANRVRTGAYAGRILYLGAMMGFIHLAFYAGWSRAM